MLAEQIVDTSDSAVEHTAVIQNLVGAIREHLKGSLCRVYSDSITYYWEEVSDSAYEPDVSIVCGKLHKKTNTKVRNIPQFVIEVLSPSTEKRDRTEKMNVYSLVGVSEYWLVNWRTQCVEIYTNDEEIGEPQFYKVTDVTAKNKEDLWIRTMPHVRLDFDEIFDLYTE